MRGLVTSLNKSNVMALKDQNKLDRFKEWNRIAQESMNYAVERFDLLIIAIGTTGIIVALNLIKTSLELDLDMPLWIKWIIKGSIISFSTSIICNFSSQLSSKRAFSLEKKWSQEIIYDLTGESSDEAMIAEYRKEADRYKKRTTRLNTTSTILLAAGFVFLAFVLLFNV